MRGASASRSSATTPWNSSLSSKSGCGNENGNWRRIKNEETTNHTRTTRTLPLCQVREGVGKVLGDFKMLADNCLRLYYRVLPRPLALGNEWHRSHGRNAEGT